MESLCLHLFFSNATRFLLIVVSLISKRLASLSGLTSLCFSRGPTILFLRWMLVVRGVIMACMLWKSLTAVAVVTELSSSDQRVTAVSLHSVHRQIMNDCKYQQLLMLCTVSRSLLFLLLCQAIGNFLEEVISSFNGEVFWIRWRRNLHESPVTA